MKEKYYSFDGKKLNFLGEFSSAVEASNYAEEYQMNFVFYVAKESEWKAFFESAKETFGETLKKLDEKEKEEIETIHKNWKAEIDKNKI